MTLSEFLPTFNRLAPVPREIVDKELTIRGILEDPSLSFSVLDNFEGRLITVRLGDAPQFDVLFSYVSLMPTIRDLRPTCSIHAKPVHPFWNYQFNPAPVQNL